MRKRILNIILITILLVELLSHVVMAASLINKNWKNDESLKLKHVDFSSIKSYTFGSQVVNFSSQGMAIGKNYVVWAQPTKDNSTTNIYIANKDTYEIKGKDSSKKFRHANGMTYNKDEDRYYVVYSTGKKHYISSFKINSSYKIADVKTKQVSEEYIGIAYDPGRKCYYVAACKNIKKVTNIFSGTYKVENMFKASKIDLTMQDIAYFGNRIYYSCYEYGGSNTPYQDKYYNSKEKHSNLIYIYKLDGTLEKTLYLANRSINGYNGVDGEIEDVYVKEDGTIVTLYNVSSTKKVVFYKIKTDVVAPILSIDYSTTEFTHQGVTVTISANEKLKSLPGWTLSSDAKKLSCKYTENAEETIGVRDAAGNESTISIKIENILDSMAGDLNDNGQLDSGDIIKIYRHIAQSNNAETAAQHPDWKLSDEKIIQGDLNKNNQIDMGDAIKIQRYMAANNNPDVAKEHPDWLVVE